MSEYKCRKTTRLKNVDYSSNCLVFLTICTKDRRCILSNVVGTGILDGPQIELTHYGKIADKYINQLNEFYDNLSVESYVVMPNHIHMILWVKQKDGPSGTPVPTLQNSAVSKFVGTYKRLCNKQAGFNLWQYRSFDHVIRNEDDYQKHLNYIYENPIRWKFDELYVEDVKEY